MAVARHNTRDMGPVAVSVICAWVAGNETLAVNNARSQSTGLLQVVVVENSAIDYRHADAGSVQPVLLPGNVAFHSRNIIIRSDLVRAIRADVYHIRVVLEPCQQLDRNPVGCPVDVVESK